MNIRGRRKVESEDGAKNVIGITTQTPPSHRLPLSPSRSLSLSLLFSHSRIPFISHFSSIKQKTNSNLTCIFPGTTTSHSNVNKVHCPSVSSLLDRSRERRVGCPWEMFCVDRWGRKQKQRQRENKKNKQDVSIGER